LTLLSVLAFLSCTVVEEVALTSLSPRGEVVEFPRDFSVPVARVETHSSEVVVTNYYYEVFDDNAIREGATAGPQFFASWHRTTSKSTLFVLENTLDETKTQSGFRRLTLNQGGTNINEASFVYFLLKNDDANHSMGVDPGLPFGLGVREPSTKRYFWFAPKEVSRFADNRTSIGYLWITTKTEVPLVPPNGNDLAPLLEGDDLLLEFSYRSAKRSNGGV
jgi:predicted cupin superfamily sugar epimerase